MVTLWVPPNPNDNVASTRTLIILSIISALVALAFVLVVKGVFDESASHAEEREQRDFVP